MRSRWHLRVNAIVLGWLVAGAAVAIGHRGVPDARWLMVHLLLLGAVSAAILIWSAHFAEAVRRRPLRGGHRDQAIRLAAHTVGAVTTIVGMSTGRSTVVVIGSVLVALVVGWHAVVLWDQGRRALASSLGWTTSYFVAAALTLPVGIALGVLLARSDGSAHARLYVAHLATMLLGWIGLTVMGTLVTLWPTMLRVRVEPGAERAARQGLVALGSGLAVVVTGAATGMLGLAAAGVGLYASGLARTAAPLVGEARRRAPSSFATWSVAAAWVWLCGSVLSWTVMLATAASWPAAEVRVGALLAPLAVGFAAQVLLGSLSYLVPMILGGGPAVVRATNAIADRGGPARLVLVNGGLALCLLPGPSLLRVGASMLVLGALIWTPVLLVRVAVVSRRPRPAGPMPVVGPPGGPAAVPAEQVGRRRGRRGQSIAAGAALALVVVAGIAADPASVGLGAAAADGVQPSGTVVEIAVEARDMRFVPSSVQVQAGDELVLVVTNTDASVHDLVLDSGGGSGRLAPHATTRVEVGVVGRDLAGWCSIAGHRQMGMVFDVVVLGGSADGSTASEHDAGHAGDAGDAASADSAGDDLDLQAEPGPDAALRDAVLAPAAEPTVHRERLVVEEVETEVAPGVRQTIWTFGGTAPGPVLRGRVGDMFEITLVNDGSIGHSIDFHAGALAPDGPMRTIEPGEELTYRFTATRSGIWMYHCATMPMSLHIANGMFGAVIIDPPDLPAVDREYVLVQSEQYFGPQGDIADPALIAAESPDAVAFNGYPNQYDRRPLTARVGERVRIWVLDAGPNRSSAFHVVGGQFDTVFLEGAYQLGGPRAGAGETGGAQVLGLQPAQGGFVELVMPEAGHYPFVSHRMVDAERGAHGILAVTD
ncbi:multicopper oxidase domain-containing protein [Pengzhenrongella frigida]|uniref:multicopper oxidase domain-containing protein n=1 Tax=Pengzhenrongella frigida TaxID=1259133 RepID=UPI001F5DD405|nr:multicopper oxidase domain-containing protein [Cellulomonas sp. HLT2-17]